MTTTFEWLRTCALAVLGSPLDLLCLLLLTAAVTAWVGLAARAAWLAEQRGYSPLLHGFLGLVLPVAYPLWMIRNPPASLVPNPAPAAPPAEAAKKKLTVPSAAARAPVAAAPPVTAVAGSATVPAAVVAGGGIAPAVAPLSAEYFLDLIGRGAVTPATPCRVECGGGLTYIVTSLIQVQAELLVANVRAPATGADQRMRLPYAKMQSVGPG